MGKKRPSGSRASAPRSSGSREQPSLIPTIKNEEQRLEALMEHARQEAADLVASAGAEAERLLARTDEEIPALLEGERAARAGALQGAAEEERRGGARLLAELRADAAKRIDQAVAYIVDRVWPVGRS